MNTFTITKVNFDTIGVYHRRKRGATEPGTSKQRAHKIAMRGHASSIQGFWRLRGEGPRKIVLRGEKPRPLSPAAMELCQREERQFWSLTGKQQAAHDRLIREVVRAKGRPEVGDSASGGDLLVWAEGLTKTHDGLRVLFEGLDVAVSEGQRVGLLGPNGSGKSTLLRILAGFEAPDRGILQVKRGLRVGYLPQEPELDQRLSVLEAVLAAPTPIMAAVRKYELALALQDGRLHALPGTPVATSGAVGGLSAREREALLEEAMGDVEALGAWDVASEAERLLSILGVEDLHKKVSELSGGQQKRVALAATLLARPDLLILDEPTNHMDVAVIEWMENVLTAPGLTVLLVTHDRFFLDRVCPTILELSGGRGFWHAGGYATFLTNRAQREAAEAAVVGRAQTVLRKESEWMRRQPKARSTKSRSRIERFFRLTEVAKGRSGHPQAGSVSGMGGVAGGESRLGSKVMLLSNATAERGGRPIFRGFGFEFGRGDRLGIVGRNGVGKSTFLEALSGKLPLSEGVREVGDTVVIGHYAQHTPPIPPDVRVIDYLKDFGEDTPSAVLPPDVAALDAPSAVPAGGARTVPRSAAGTRGVALDAARLLEQFGFPRPRHHARVALLSGGEKRRLYLATVLMRRPNFLLLDEPTNDLDLATIHVLEEYLESFEGCVLVASHDRAFMDTVATRQFVLEGDGQIQLYDGLYSEYLEDVKAQATRAGKDFDFSPALAPAAASDAASGIGGRVRGGSSGGSASKPVNAAKAASRRKLSYMERKEFESLEGEIAMLSMEKEILERKVGVVGTSCDFGAMSSLTAQLAAVVSKIDQKSDRWLELAEIECQ